MKKIDPDVGIIWGANLSDLVYPYYVHFPRSFQKTPCKYEQEAKNAALNMQRVLQSRGIAAFVGRKDLEPIESS